MVLEEFKNIVPESNHHYLLEWWNSLGEKLHSELESFYIYSDTEVIEITGNINSELFEREKRIMEAQEIEDLEDYDFPNQDYYENLVGHEVYLCLRGPTFHICKAHKNLRLVLSLGVLPKYFECYFSNKKCHMVKYLNKNGKGFWVLR